MPRRTPTRTHVRVPRAEQDLLTRMAKALSHPLRKEVLTRVAAGAGDVSPKSISRETGQPLGNVSYHVKALSELGLISETGTAQRRGAIEHYYGLSKSAKKDLRQLADLADRFASQP